MKNRSCTVLMLAGLLALPACSSSKKKPTVPVFQEGGVAPPAKVVVDTFKATGTVTVVDVSNHRVTLETSGGKKTTFRAVPTVINFDQIRIAHRLRATVAEEVVAYLGEETAALKDATGKSVEVATKASKPGIMASTIQVTGGVRELDAKRHKATLEFPDGSSRTVRVSEDVDLTKRRVGETVVIRTTEPVAVEIESLE